MSIAAGARFGPYEITGSLGAGGMGEVWRARDTRLGRDVAIKILPPELAENEKFLQRFEREARAISSLNHPHICTLHDVGEARVEGRESRGESVEGEAEQPGLSSSLDSRPSSLVHYLVMELIEGESLADRLKKGPLSLNDALRYGDQIASALDAAHRRGIVHRDVKPGNIMLTRSGAKLVDFGLARGGFEQPSADLAELPTEAKPLTREGVIVGTLQYMAPEQLDGKEADARSDIFAIGCVLYEMITGSRPFQGISRSALISSIVNDDTVGIHELRSGVPTSISRIVHRCLEKDPDERWQSAHDLSIELRWAAHGDSGEVSRSKRGFPAWVTYVLLIIALIAIGLALSTFSKRSATGSSTPKRFSVQLSEGVQFHAPDPVNLAVSPDGRRIAFDAAVGEARRLYLREIDSLEITPLRGTEGAMQPFFSPDGASVGFWADGKLKRIDLDGGLPTVICDLDWGGGASWGDDGVIVANEGWAGGLVEVPADGGTPRPLTEVEGARESHLWPQAVPGGDLILYTRWQSSLADISVEVYSRKTGQSRTLIEGGSFARLLPGGRLLYADSGRLMARMVDPATLESLGTAVAVLDDLQQGPDDGDASYSVSAEGTLAYRPGGMWMARRRISWVDRRGESSPLELERAAYEDVTLSPDETKLAIATFRAGLVSLHVHNLSNGTTSRVTSDAYDNFPVWSPDGRKLAFTTSRLGSWDIYVTPVDRSSDVAPLVTSDNDDVALSWSHDGEKLLFVNNYTTVRSLELSTGSITDVASVNQLNTGTFSPDGRWVAFSSGESSGLELLVAAADGSGGIQQISSGGGDRPVWSPDGDEIFFVQGSRMMRVEVRWRAGRPVFGPPEELFEKPYFSGEYGGFDYDARRDRFLMIEPSENEISETSFVVVTDFLAEIDGVLAKTAK